MEWCWDFFGRLFCICICQFRLNAVWICAKSIGVNGMEWSGKKSVFFYSLLTNDSTPMLAGVAMSRPMHLSHKHTIG